MKKFEGKINMPYKIEMIMILVASQLVWLILPGRDHRE
jgi:hypothetical protein